MKEQPDAHLVLPEGLREQFARLERRLWGMDTVLAAGGALAALLASWLLLFISDRFWDTPGWLRAGLLGVGIATAGWFVIGWVRCWVLQRRDWRDLSRIVQGHYRRLGDRLLGIVELSDEAKRTEGVSPALIKAAIEQVSTEAVKLDFRAAVATRRPTILAVAALVLLVLVLVPCVLLPAAGWSTFVRWAWPGSGVARFTFVNLDQLPDRLVVPHGEGFEIAVGTRLHRWWRGARAVAQFENQPAIETGVAADQARFQVPGQTKPGTLRISIGDVSRRLTIDPQYRPALRELTARVEYPPYLQYPATNEALRNAGLTVVEGTKLGFTGVANRPLASARLHRDGAPAGEALVVNAESFSTPPAAVPASGRATFEWRDVHGLSNAAPWVLQLQVRSDAAPQAECPDQAATVAILEEEVLEIRGLAQDDFGLRRLGVEWEAAARQGTNIVARQEATMAPGAPQARQLDGSYKFSPALLGVPVDTIVTLKAFAEDYFPNRRRAESATHRIYVLSREEHARLVQQQIEKMMAELEEVTRRQEALLEAARDLRGDPQKLNSEEGAKQLGNQAQQQAALQDKMQNLSRRGAETLKEAMRNKSIPTDTLGNLARSLEMMQNIAGQPMAGAQQNLSQAQNQNGNREQKADEAIQNEEKAAQQLAELAKKLGNDLDKLNSATLIERLKRLAAQQADVRGALQAALPVTIGMKPEKVPEPQKGTFQTLASRQGGSGRESQSVQDEISRFHDRTSAEVFGEVARAMKASRVAEELPRNGDLIRQNVLMQAMNQAGEFEAKFKEWAEKLQGAQQEGGGGGGGGGGQMDEALIRRLMALFRLRQSEDNLREQTGALAAQRNTPAYLSNTRMLSVAQSLLVDDTEALEAEKAGKFLNQASDAMQEADKLLSKAKTDQPTLNAQSDALNLVDAEIKELMKNSSGGGKGRGAVMAMLMQMMGMNPGPTGGGNTSGGTTTDPGKELTGDARGRADGPRTVEKAGGGRSARAIPAEFRDAMMQYQKAIDLKGL